MIAAASLESSPASEARPCAAFDHGRTLARLDRLNRHLELLNLGLEAYFRGTCEGEAFTNAVTDAHEMIDAIRETLEAQVTARRASEDVLVVLDRACDGPDDVHPARGELRRLIGEACEVAELLDRARDDELDQDAPGIIGAAVGFVSAQRRCLDERLRANREFIARRK